MTSEQGTNVLTWKMVVVSLCRNEAGRKVKSFKISVTESNADSYGQLHLRSASN
jgi:hypothetical protein